MNPDRITAAVMAYEQALADHANRGQELTRGDRHTFMEFALEASDRVMETNRDGFSFVLAPDLPPHIVRLVGQQDVIELNLFTGSVVKVEKRLLPTLAEVREPNPTGQAVAP